MAITLTGTNQVTCGSMYTFPLTGGLTVAVTLQVTGSPANGARIVAKWGNDGLLNESFLLAHNTSGQIFFGIREHVSFDHTYYQTTATGLVTNGALLRIVARYTVGGTPEIWLNGVQEAMSLVDASGTMANVEASGQLVEIGYESASGTNAVPGDYSEVALWSTAVPDWVCTAYGKGMSPRFYRTADSLFYLPLHNTSRLTDEWVGTLTTNSSGTDSAHPRMYYPDLGLDGDAIPTSDDHLIIVSAGSLTLTGLNPILPRVVAPGVGALVITGRGVPEENTPILLGVGGLVLTGLAPVVTGTASLDVGGLILTGLAPTLFVLTTAHVSALAVEVSRPAPRAGAHVSSLHTEVLAGQPATAQVSMLIVEVLRYFTEPPCIDVHPAGCPVEFAPPPAGGDTGCVANFGPTGTVTS